MRKIAIIQYVDAPYDSEYGEFMKLIASRITEWQEVTEDDYWALVHSSHKGKYAVVEFLPNQQDLIMTTVAEYRQFVAREEAAAQKRREARLKKKQERKQAKEAQIIAEKKKLLEQLKKELSISTVKEDS